MQPDQAVVRDTSVRRVRQFIFGAPKYINDPQLFHKMSLVPLLAWIGLGADGLSSSAYGPEDDFRALLGSHTYLAILLGLATALTGQLTFCLVKFYHRTFHNQTAFAIQRRLQGYGITTVILPVRICLGESAG